MGLKGFYYTGKLDDALKNNDLRLVSYLDHLKDDET